jgi:UDP-2,3-diacylglucosamine pyrophosphatase LpxH
MSDKTRRFFISDIHLGGEKAWHKISKHQGNLLAFLKWLRAQPDIKDIVLLGDSFDTWMYPMNDRPESIVEIGRRHSEVIQAIARCSATNGGSAENIFCVSGNHDMHLAQGDLDTLFGDGVVQHVPCYNAGLLYGEHGHRFGMFNAPDKLHDPQDGLPLGYFITRMVASSGLHYDSPGAALGCVDDLLEAAFTTQAIAASVIEALMERFGMRPDAEFVMPYGRRSVTIGEVQKKYAPLYTRWVEKFGHYYALQAIRGEGGSLGWFADRLSNKLGLRVVVLGHTHRGLVEEDTCVVKNRIYANAGYWCDDRKQSFVEIDKQPKGRFAVKLWSVAAGDIRMEKKEEI